MILTEHLQNQLRTLPEEPGIYQYFNEQGILIYVGKAKNLKKRVLSYFNKKNYDKKTQTLVKQIRRVECIVVNSESDALILENNLIKTNQPKYNILLKDDKTYPFVVITKELFPRIFSTRKFNPELGHYYGPFTSIGAMRSVLELIKKVLPIRSCDLNLTPLNISKQKFKKCLEYYIGNCKAPCEALQTAEEYNQEILQAKEILAGDLSIVKWHFMNQMNLQSIRLNFEEAQKIKEKLIELENYQSKTLITNQKFTNTAVFTIKQHSEKFFVNYTRIHHSRIIQSKTTEIIQKLDETESAMLSFFINNHSEEIVNNEIIVNTPVNILQKYTLPKIGDKKKLVELSLKNIDTYIKQHVVKFDKETHQDRILKILQNELNLPTLPRVIECFDNSNIQGYTPVAAMVYFKNGVPCKKEYRHFNIKTVIGPNDFESMREIVYRRYHRLIAENSNLPDLIIIDGGKGQLHAAIDSLKKLQIYGKIPIISIAKRLEEIYFPEDDLPMMLKKNSEALKLIQRIRDETHRFAITFHRKKRDNIKKGGK